MHVFAEGKKQLEAIGKQLYLAPKGKIGMISMG
jgi:hypothetical protein